MGYGKYKYTGTPAITRCSSGNSLFVYNCLKNATFTLGEKHYHQKTKKPMKPHETSSCHPLQTAFTSWAGSSGSVRSLTVTGRLLLKFPYFLGLLLVINKHYWCQGASFFFLISGPGPILGQCSCRS